MPKDEDTNCTAIGRIIKDLCSCSENGAWSPDMTSEKPRDPFLKSELTNMSAVRTRIINLAKKRNREITEQPKLEKDNLARFSNRSINRAAIEQTTLRKNINNYLQSRHLYAIDEELYEKPIQPVFKYSSCGENWSLSKSWSTKNYCDAEFNKFVVEKPKFDQLEKIEESPVRKRKRENRMKEQLRYDKNIKRHIRIRVMLSLRMRRYIKRRRKNNTIMQNLNIPPRRFPRGTSLTSSFGTRSYKSVLIDKISDGTVLFDVHEARNTTMELCHDFRDDLDTLAVALRAGNFRSGRLAVEGWWCGRAMPSAAEGAGAAAVGGRADNGALALHYAAARGCLDCVRLLANTTPDVSANTAMDNDVTPVYLAAQEGHLAVLQYLVLEAGGRLDARARDGMQPVHAAAQTGCLDCLKWMIVERGVDPNSRDGDGATPLHFAASRGHLATVRWLLRHGAKLHLDRHGKSPINDAAENHHLECLNLLVAAGAESKQLSAYNAAHTCACAPGDARCALPSCINATTPRPPFYLHSPGQPRRGSLPALADGVYVNPMRGPLTPGSQQSSGEDSSGCSASDADTGSGGWFLHSNNSSNNNSNTNTNKKNYNSNGNAPAALYQRVRDLFQTPHSPGPGTRSPAEGQEAPTMTVKAEVHGSTEAGAVPEVGSDSDSGADAARRDHDYEDIYLPRDDHQRHRSNSQDSGSHSRPGSAALVVDYIVKDRHDPSSKTYEVVGMAPAVETTTRSSIVSKLAALTHKAQNLASRLSSAAGSRRPSVSDEVAVTAAPSGSSGVSSGGSSGDEAPPPPPPPPAPPAPPPPVVLEEPALRPSELKGRLGARRGSAASADEERPRGPNLVNKQPALPFVPPAFPHAAPDRLIKPSEYLKTITAPCKRDDGGQAAAPPPAPPAPPAPPPPAPPAVAQHQPLAAISSAELCAVRLRAPAAKTLSAPTPTRSVSLQCLPTADYRAQKTDLIEELKQSKDITGIRKMKVERARRESLADKETFVEFTKRFTADNFVDQVPERDASGNAIPAWKRQMLARRAAERAKKDLERELAGEAERRRAAAVPAWKRQLLQRREEAENRLRQSLYTPKVEDSNGSEWRGYSASQRAVSIDNITLSSHYDAAPLRAPSEAKFSTDTHLNGHSTPNGKHADSDDETKIIPWRAQLRKTNSKLNLLE